MKNVFQILIGMAVVLFAWHYMLFLLDENNKKRERRHRARYPQVKPTQKFSNQ
jgi:hypothetical protein